LLYPCVNFNDYVIGRQLRYDWDNKIIVTQLNHILMSATTPLIVYRSHHCDLDRSTPNTCRLL